MVAQFSSCLNCWVSGCLRMDCQVWFGSCWLSILHAFWCQFNRVIAVAWRSLSIMRINIKWIFGAFFSFIGVVSDWILRDWYVCQLFSCAAISFCNIVSVENFLDLVAIRIFFYLGAWAMFYWFVLLVLLYRRNTIECVFCGSLGRAAA